MNRNTIPVASLTDQHFIDLASIEDWLMLCPESECAACDGTRISFEFEYVRVDGIEIETFDCVRLDTEIGSFGLPPDLLVDVVSFPLDNTSGL